MNAIRTVLGIIAMILVPLMSFLGCTEVAGGTVSCASSWIDPKWAPAISIALGVLVYLLKGWGQGGSFLENLFNKSVVVTTEVKPGTVTPSQVNSG